MWEYLISGGQEVQSYPVPKSGWKCLTGSTNNYLRPQGVTECGWMYSEVNFKFI